MGENVGHFSKENLGSFSGWSLYNIKWLNASWTTNEKSEDLIILMFTTVSSCGSVTVPG